MDKTPIDRLRKLRKKANKLAITLVKDLKPFLYEKDEITFRRLPYSESTLEGVSVTTEGVSVTTTCTCLMALTMADKLKDLYGPKPENTARKAFESIVSVKWDSSGLGEPNPFTSTLVLRAFSFLKEKGHVSEKDLDEMKHKDEKGCKERTLREVAESLVVGMPKEFRVLKYPAAPAIVYWFIDAVERSDFSLESWQDIFIWASHSFFRQFSRVSSKQETLMDPIAMAMAASLSAKLRKIAKEAKLGSSSSLLANLPSKLELENSIHILFNDHQSECGIWPKHFPLFHYPDAGSNYCFAFEMLEALLTEFGHDIILKDKNDIILKGLEDAVRWCDDNRLEYLESTTNEEYFGWNSGGQLATLEVGMPESWATAVVHMFLHKLQEVLTDRIEGLVLSDYSAKEHDKADSEEWDRLLDIDLELEQTEEKITVKDLLNREMLSTIAIGDRKHFRNNPMKSSRSALLFGPPGTSKTALVKAIAQKLGWPCILIDPSHFLSKGLESIYSKADDVFQDLSDLSGAVILFDEMDALVLTREENKVNNIDITSRFLTTSMLPKLAQLHDEGKVIFFMATNYEEKFDQAIKRPGRFDLLLCMWPPSWKRKLERLDVFYEAEDLDECRNILSEYVQDAPTKEMLDRFTYGDMKAFINNLRRNSTLKQALADKSKFLSKVVQWANFITLNEVSNKDATERYKGQKKTSKVQLS
ncbi:MAG TPA: ATP-binding protein [Sedimentisphaerales bacterium]|nr:ATP-binding protein [Sedimentisphaerales bacterium]